MIKRRINHNDSLDHYWSCCAFALWTICRNGNWDLHTQSCAPCCESCTEFFLGQTHSCRVDSPKPIAGNTLSWYESCACGTQRRNNFGRRDDVDRSSSSGHVEHDCCLAIGRSVWRCTAQRTFSSFHEFVDVWMFGHFAFFANHVDLDRTRSSCAILGGYRFVFSWISCGSGSAESSTHLAIFARWHRRRSDQTHSS